MYIAFVFTLLAAISEGFGLLMLIPLLQGLDKSEKLTNTTVATTPVTTEPPNMVTTALTNILEYFGLNGSATALLAVITIAFIIKGILLFLAMGFNAQLKAKLLRELKSRLMKNYSSMQYSYYSQNDTGHFVNTINEQINRTLQSFFDMNQMISQFAQAFIYITLAMIVAWQFGLMALLAGVLLLFIFKHLNNYVRRISRESAMENGNLSKLLIQTLHSFKYLSSTNKLHVLRAKIDSSIGKLAYFEARAGIASAFTQAAKEPISVTLIMLIVFVQISIFQQPLTPILVTILLFYRGLSTTLQTQKEWQHTLQCIGSLEHVHSEFLSIAQHQEATGEIECQELDTCISFDDVSFSYEGGNSTALNNITLNIDSKSSVALVGASGAGKSTMADLITLLHNPSSGVIRIGGVPSTTLNKSSWRNKIGYVSQETVIFDDSIANNISLWNGEGTSPEKIFERIKFAAEQAHISDFINSLPDGYQTMVGDRGVRLSGGQRQRIFIARELYRTPKILILDEATSALDSESERAIQKSIDALIGKITVIIIAHRLSTIRSVDKVFVFDGGFLIEQGTYEQLIENQTTKFSRLASLQAL